MKKKTPGADWSYLSPIDPAVSKAAAALGQKGGRSGTGASKRRTPAHYRKLAAARQAAKLRRIANINAQAAGISQAIARKKVA